MSEESPKIMALIPCYNEGKRIAAVVGELLAVGGITPVVVDDGSADDTAEVAKRAGATVIRFEQNRGKGAALDAGFAYALDNAFDAVVTLDGDGQHKPSEAAAFVEAFTRTGAHLVLGTRMANTRTMPLIRRMTNRFMSWLISRLIKHRISDTQCGYRLISAKAIPVARQCASSGFAAESEMLMQFALNGFTIDEVDISTIYGDEKSKIRPIRDFFRFVNLVWRYYRLLHKHRRAAATPRNVGAQ